MRPAEVVRRGAEYLERHGIEAPRVNAEALMMRVLDVDRAGLYAREQGLGSAEARAYGRALCLRCTGTPLQHLTGEQGFRHLVLTVRPGVFVPRPETEVLVDVALELLEGIETPCVVDLCTGSGAVALAIADEHPGTRVTATDRSEAAVDLARENAERLGLEVELRRGEGTAVAAEGWDIVVANPPYVESLEDVPRELRWEPKVALLGSGEHERLARAARARFIVFEAGDGQAGGVAGMLERLGCADVAITADLTGRARVVEGKLP